MRFPKVVLGQNVFIGRFVKIGEGSQIQAGAVIGDRCVLGRNCLVGSQASIQNCTAGEGVVFKPGCRVGQDGFGFIPAGLSSSPHPVKKPQTRRVVLGDEVEIGANSTVDRGSWRDTTIGRHTKLDNQVHVAHNVRIGESCLIAAQTGIAGSVEIGHRVLIGGQSGVAQYIQIGDEAQIAAKSGVTANVPARAKVGGYPAVPIAQFHRAFLLSQSRVRDPRQPK
ncbi:UDP-3-O-[3-hydroxymyristoyl] glucosamine N-acyltransferase [Batrachochytrium salamandrivorans]|nr:UDP-3-O-[3-hydroxymyristoyl] glucosamine N-acyltransferase [Batrachochytrium salamandrivorans]KAH9262824.1 UDP-3-O-[3-hydroxymyristoyl] glucosamine N-acyltransferase [Batrachochytrium salamandrivorans]